jgi:hypothetical protein
VPSRRRALRIYLKPLSPTADTEAVRRTYIFAALIVVIGAVGAAVLVTMRAKKPETTTATTTPASTRPTEKTAKTPAFSTTYPAGWSDRVRSGPHESVQHKLTSTAAPIGRLGIPPAGTVGITINDTPASGVVLGHHFSEEALKAVALLPLNVGTPATAEGVTQASHPRTVTLDGVEAAEESYAYTYGGRQNVQVDIVAQHKGRIVFIELDAEPSQSSQSQAALTQVTSTWRWS